MLNSWKSYAVFVLFFGFMACKNGPSFPEKPLLTECAIPVTLGMDSTLVLLADFIPQTELIDSVSVSPKLHPKFDSKAGTLLLTYAPDSVPVQSILTIWSKGFSYDILLRKSHKIASIISYAPSQGKPKKVQMAGDINSWSPANTELTQEDGIWKTKIYFNPGR